jgi:hypothetical protein
LGALLGQDKATFLVFFLKNEGLYNISNGHNLRRVNVVLDGKFAGGNYTLSFVSHVEENLVAVNLDDGTFNEVTVVEEFESFLDLGQEVFGAADVVNCDLLEARGWCS